MKENKKQPEFSQAIEQTLEDLNDQASEDVRIMAFAQSMKALQAKHPDYIIDEIRVKFKPVGDKHGPEGDPSDLTGQ